MQITLIYSLLIFLILFILLEGRRLVSKKEWKQVIVSSLILALALLYGTDYALGAKILPNPNWSLKILKPASHAIDKFFQLPE